MTDTVIKVEKLGKRYRVGQTTGYGTVRDAVANIIAAPFRKNKSVAVTAKHETPDKYIWALKDISVEVKRGEALGIIGGNGAGKTTLLRLLTRITEPTEGYAEIRGRVGSLLEVGTGFHPELTGRENIFLNGAVLGMKNREVKREFDNIVEFSGVEQFIDTPLKRYSTGMQMRLAFSIAAHMEPEILLIDEVLAVGDAQFQKKCLGKMEEVGKSGRTVLFVSHNMSAIKRLCSRAILLQKGRLVKEGPPDEVINDYLDAVSETGGSRVWSAENAPGTDIVLTSVKIANQSQTNVSSSEVQEPLQLHINYSVKKPGLSFRCAAIFYTQGVCAFASVEPSEVKRDKAGSYSSILSIPPNLLAEGDYAVSISIFSSQGMKNHYVQVKDAIVFRMFDPMTGDSARGDYVQNMGGVVCPLLDWQMDYEGTPYTPDGRSK
jgi:lipopolysaccharide transport system ATP-binding protein